MAIIQTIFSAAATYDHDILNNGVATYNASQHQVILTNASTFTRTASLLAVIQEMLTDANGYTEQNWNPGAASWDAIQNRSEMSSNVAWSFTGTVTFDRYVLLSDRPFVENLGIRKKGSRVVDTIDAAGNKLTFGLTDPIDLPADTPVTVTADAGGTVPAELLDGGNPRLLYVRNPVDTVSERSIQLALTAGGSPIDFGSGTGPIRVRYAGGKLRWYGVFDTPQTVAGSFTIVLPDNYGDGNADVNAV